MRDIGSRKITGPEAILVAIVVWWFEQHPNLEQYINESLVNADLNKFTSRINLDLGNSLSLYFPVNKVIQNFWDVCKNNLVIKHLIEQATRSQRQNNLADKIKVTHEFVNKLIICELGEMIKQSNFIKKNLIAIEKLRKERNKDRNLFKL